MNESMCVERPSLIPGQADADTHHCICWWFILWFYNTSNGREACSTGRSRCGRRESFSVVLEKKTNGEKSRCPAVIQVRKLDIKTKVHLYTKTITRRVKYSILVLICRIGNMKHKITPSMRVKQFARVRGLTLCSKRSRGSYSRRG